MLAVIKNLLAWIHDA